MIGRYNVPGFDILQIINYYEGSDHVIENQTNIFEDISDTQVYD